MNKLKHMHLIAVDLKAITEDRGLSPRFVPDDYGFTVHLQDDARGLYCPIAIRVSWLKQGREASAWSSAVLIRDWIEERKIGHNGWRAFVPVGSNIVARFEESAAALHTLSGYLKELELIPMPSRELAQVSFNEDFANAYEAVEEATETIEDVRIECRRVGKIESYNFADESDRGFTLQFSDGLASLAVDGEQVAQVQSDDPDEIGRMVSKSIRALKSKNRFGRR